MLNVKIESEDPTQITLLINSKRYQYASTSQINSKFKWFLSKNKGKALAYLRKEAELLKRKDYDPNFHVELPEGEKMRYTQPQKDIEISLDRKYDGMARVEIGYIDNDGNAEIEASDYRGFQLETLTVSPTGEILHQIIHESIDENVLKMKTIEIKEEFRIPNTDIVIEKGDTIRVISEGFVAPDTGYYYERVADYFSNHWDIPFTLDTFVSNNTNREIVFTSYNKDEIIISQNWRDEGSSSKPMTSLEVELGLYDDPTDKEILERNLGRFSIDFDPEQYAEDITDIIDRNL